MRGIILAVGFATLASTAAAQTGDLPRAAVTAGLQQADCEMAIEDSLKEITSYALGHGLRLIQVPCWAAAYNFGSVLFVVDAKAPEKARLLNIPTWSQGKPSETYDLTLPAFDEKTKVLRSYHKGRGVGDCGEAGQWRWTGTTFKLTGYWDKEDCDGKVFKRTAQWRVYPPRKR
jgi:hypothetical protein